MPLVASCDALYFPDQPRDNVISFRWQPGNAADADADADAAAPALQPNTTLIFKIKSTAPQLFYVKPHYGALLLVDPTAMATPQNFQVASIQFGLRSNYADSANGNNNNNTGGASPTGDAATVATRQYNSESPNASRHQERFVVDYAVMQCEPLAYQQVAQAFHDTAKLTEVVKSIWALISSGAVARSHVGLRGNVGLKVYLHNVFLSADDAAAEARASGGGGGKPVLVPEEARLVPCSLADRLGGSNASRSTHRAMSPNANTADSSTSAVSPPRKGDALRSLKEEVKALRQEVRTPQDGNSRSVTPTNVGQSPTLASPDLSAARRHLQMHNSDLSDPDDILMKVNLDPNAVTSSAAGKPAQKRKGMKLYLLLAIMFAVYLLCMLLRRGGEMGATTGWEVNGDATHSHDNAAVALRTTSAARSAASKVPKKLPAPRQPGVTSLDL